MKTHYPAIALLKYWLPNPRPLAAGCPTLASGEHMKALIAIMFTIALATTIQAQNSPNLARSQRNLEKAQQRRYDLDG